MWKHFQILDMDGQIAFRKNGIKIIQHISNAHFIVSSLALSTIYFVIVWVVLHFLWFKLAVLG